MVAKAKKTVKSSKAKAAAKPAKKAASTKATSAKKSVSVIKDPLNKTGIIAKLVEMTGLQRKHVVDVLDGMNMLIGASIKKGGSGVFVMPGLMKIMVVRKPATKARKGVNPFTGEEMVFKAKPARNVVKIRPLKKIKEMAE